jgi:hypothetical protein
MTPRCRLGRQSDAELTGGAENHNSGHTGFSFGSTELPGAWHATPESRPVIGKQQVLRSVWTSVPDAADQRAGCSSL